MSLQGSSLQQSLGTEVRQSNDVSAEAARSPGRAVVKAWLFTIAGLIFVMVLVGGATRLTESGLSITQWKPVTGVIPPLSEADWREEFLRYQQIPQFARLNADMTLAGFKTIFWWEWSHRLLARILGAAFVLPALWFWARGRLGGALGRRVAVATGLLALEPVVGWWMVSSGLSERTEVAQERLAIHLLIAAGTFAALIHAGVGMGAGRRERVGAGFAAASVGLAALVFLQLGLGALVAGLRAGKMLQHLADDGRQLAALGGLRPVAPAALDFDDATTAQFDHRLVGYAVVAFALAMAAAAARGAAGTGYARRCYFLAVIAFAQATLGVFTLLWVAPIGLALPHQALALLLFGMAVAHASATARDRAAL